MTDKPIKQAIDDEDFSLNHLDLNDDKTTTDIDDEDAFNHLIQEDEQPFDAYAHQKQEPGVPDIFEDEAYDTANHDLFEEDAPVPNADVNTGVYASEPEHLEQDDVSTQPADVHMIAKFVAVAVVIVAIVAWLNMGDDDDVHGQGGASVEPLSMGSGAYPTIQSMAANGQQKDASVAPGVHQEKAHQDDQNGKLALMQERLSSMQKRLDEQALGATQRSSQHSSQNSPQSDQAQVMAVVKKPTTAFHAVKPHPVLKQASKKVRGWAVIIASVNSYAAAAKGVAKLKAKGIAAVVSPTTIKGKAWYRISVGGFASRHAAEVQRSYLVSKHHIKGAWIHKPE